jgi:uncharacterized protein (DUF2062 family)
MDRVAGRGRDAVNEGTWLVVGIVAVCAVLAGLPGMALVVVLGAWAWGQMDRRSGKERRKKKRRRVDRG